MRIVYHLGAHCTDDDRLIRCLLKNRGILAEQGIIIPSPTRYRKLLRDTAVQLKGAAATEETEALILDQIMDEDTANRLVFSWDSFLSFPNWALRDQLYCFAGERVRAFTQVFPDIEPEFHLSIRNPATFVPALRERVLAKSGDDILAGVDPTSLRWSAVVRQILEHNPGVPMTVWCDEDLPLICPEVLQAISGHAPETVLGEADEVLSTLLTEAGLARYRSYCQEHPPETAVRRRRIVTAFLERFGRPEELQIELDAPGWTEALVEQLTTAYLEDVDLIRSLPEVRFIEP